MKIKLEGEGGKGFYRFTTTNPPSPSLLLSRPLDATRRKAMEIVREKKRKKS